MEQQKLPEELLQFCKLPFKLVPHSLRVFLSLHLNTERSSHAPTTDNLQDWRGVAEVLGFSPLEIQNFQRFNDPLGEVLKNLKVAKQDPTVEDLLSAILHCERFDILEDPCLTRHLQKIKPSPIQEKMEKELQDPNIDSCSGEYGCLTVGEADSGMPEYFDAFVCYNPVDLPFVKSMMMELEEKHHFKLCIPERDFLPGPSKYEAITKLIQERCSKFIVVLSPDFMKSEECNFMLNFAHSLQPSARKKKVIPILYKKCEIPGILAFITLVDYTRHDVIDWFWNRLSRSLKAPTVLMFHSARTSVDPPCTSHFQDTVRLKTKKNQDDFLEIQYESTSTPTSGQAARQPRRQSPIEDFIDVSTEVLPLETMSSISNQNKSFSFTQRFKF